MKTTPFRTGVLGLALALAAGLSTPALSRQPGRPAIIVQDFRNRSYELRHDWVGTGLAYLVRKNLANLGSMEILEDRRAKPEDAEPVADYVVEGEIRLDEADSGSEAKFIVFVTLDRTSDSAGRRQFLTEGRSAQLFEMADYLAERMAKHVGIDLSDAVRSRFGRGMTRNLTAFQIFSEAIVERRIHAKIDAYEKAVGLDPRFSEAHFHLARVYTVLRDYGKAEAALRKAIEIVPDFSSAHNDLGYVLAQLGRLGDAETEYRTAVASDSDDARYRLNLADVLRAAGRNHAAREEYQAALRLAPDLPEARNALAALGGEVAGSGVAPPTPAATPAVVIAAAIPTPPATRQATPAPKASPIAVPTPAPVANPRGGETTGEAAPASKEDRTELAAARQTATRARGDKAAASALLSEAERSFSRGDRAAAYMALGRLYLAEKMNYAAVTALRTAAAADPARREAHQELAVAYERAGMKGEAAKARALAAGGS